MRDNFGSLLSNVLDRGTWCADYGGTMSGRDVFIIGAFLVKHADLVRCVGVSSILIISNTVSGPPGSTPLSEHNVYVDIRFRKSITSSVARQQNYSSCMFYFNYFESAGGRCGHQFLLNFPCETPEANLPPLFPVGARF